MVLRSAGEVGCAHCKTIGADQSCQICTRLVCPKCAADWSTCSETAGRVVRLGRSARVRDVDPLGKLALVSHWRQPLRIFDLRQLRWMPGVELPRRLYLLARPFPPRLTADGHLVHAQMTVSIAAGIVTDPNQLGASDVVLGGFKKVSLATGDSTWLVEPRDDAPFVATAVTSTKDWLTFVSSSQKVVVVEQEPRTDAEHATANVTAANPALDNIALESIAVAREPPPPPRSICRTFEPLPRKVVQAAQVDAERELLVSASWSELALHRIVGDKLELLGRAKTVAQGDARWVAVAGGYVAVAIYDMTRGTTIEVRTLNRDGSLGPIATTIPPLHDFKAAALSRDGRYLAAADDRRLHVHELDHDRVTVFDDHTDAINYVRFASDDHMLISADTDNRVILRPRTPAGYPRVLIPVSVPAG